MDISNDELNAISGDANSEILLWDLDRRNNIWKFSGHNGQVCTVKFTNNKRFAASGVSDMMIIVWDIFNHEEYAVLYGHENYIWKILITKDDKQIVSGSFSEGIFVWNFELMSKIYRFESLQDAKGWLINYKEMKSEFSRFLF